MSSYVALICSQREFLARTSDQDDQVDTERKGQEKRQAPDQHGENDKFRRLIVVFAVFIRNWAVRKCRSTEAEIDAESKE